MAGAMTFNFKPAVREKTSLLIALAGASGSGKTLSALKLARGLAGEGGKIAVIDTEAGRALHYADEHRFDHCDLMPPFTPKRYTEAIEAADKAGYDVIVIDSMSHEYESFGGILEWADQELANGVKSPKNWVKPKTAHKRMVNRLIQMRAHLVICLRAEEKMEMREDKDEQGRTRMIVIAAEQRPIEERWHPICEKRFMYEMTVSLLLVPSNPGVPIPIKLQDQHKPAFSDGQQISEDSGAFLHRWASGGKAEPADRTDKSLELVSRADEAAGRGVEAFRSFWRKLPAADRETIRASLPSFEKKAKIAEQGTPEEDDPFGLPPQQEEKTE